ncbi:MAG: biotin transporter BioY [Alphaproteobacteria bacterium]
MIRTGASQATLAASVWPSASAPTALSALLLMLAGSAFIALSAQIQVPLWPVPMTGQTFAVLLVGVAFGWRLGAATLLAYMAEGAIGIPVFAKAAAGPAVIVGPTGGYIMGFVLAAALVGYLAERGWDRNVWSTALAMLFGNLVIYLLGVPWLAAFLAGIGNEAPWQAAIAGGLTPFLLGDGLKLALAACLLPVAWKFLGRKRRE